MFAIYLLFYKDITILYMHKKKFPHLPDGGNFY